MDSDSIKYDLGIFEREDEVGGRVKSIIIPGSGQSSLDLGASDISVNDENTFALLRSLGLQDRLIPILNNERVVIWNGKSIVANIPDYEHGWHEWTQMLLQYGTNFIRGLKFAKTISSTLRKISTRLPFRDIYATLRALGAENSCWETPPQYLRQKWITGKFVDELIQAKVRGMYGQNMLNLSSFLSAPAVITEPRFILKGGLQHLVEKLVDSSGATVRLSQAVSELSTRDSTSAVRLRSMSQGKSFVDDFEAVVIAAPWSSTGIELPDLMLPPADREYVDRHVTHFITRLPLDPAAFGLNDSSVLPKTILTVPGTDDRDQSEKLPEEGTAGFFSLSTRKISSPSSSSNEYLHRVLASRKFSNALLQTQTNLITSSGSTLSTGRTHGPAQTSKALLIVSISMTVSTPRRISNWSAVAWRPL